MSLYPSRFIEICKLKLYNPKDWIRRERIELEPPMLGWQHERIEFINELKKDLKDLKGSWVMVYNRSYIEGIPYGSLIFIDFSRKCDMIKIGLKYS